MVDPMVREQELALTVQVRKKVLMELLEADQRSTTRAWGSVQARTFEDKAAEVAQKDPEVAQALLEFQEAVNTLWLHAVDQKLPEKLAREWHRKNQKLGSGRRDEIEAEVMFAIREQIIRFEPRGVPLMGYARRGVFSWLNQWRGQDGPIQRTVHDARETPPEEYRRPWPHEPTMLGKGGGRNSLAPLVVDTQRGEARVPAADLKDYSVQGFEEALHDYWDERGWAFEEDIE